jgi:putative nucleic acid binding protein
MQIRTRIFVLILLLASAAAGYGWYQYTRKPPDIRRLSPDIKIEAQDLVNEFRNSETEANKKYVDKILLVHGKVTNVVTDSNGQVTLFIDGNDPLCAVICSLSKVGNINSGNLVQGNELSIKGKCTGILTDVILNECIIVK